MQKPRLNTKVRGCGGGGERINPLRGESGPGKISYKEAGGEGLCVWGGGGRRYIYFGGFKGAGATHTQLHLEPSAVPLSFGGTIWPPQEMGFLPPPLLFQTPYKVRGGELAWVASPPFRIRD